jgi:hypothetical protein
MKMKMKNKITILILLTQLMLITSAEARCNLELFRFGSSAEEIKKQLNLPDGGMLPIVGNEFKNVVFVPGEKVCKYEKAFEGAPINFVFLYDKLVEIQTTRLSGKPTMINWAESVYGEKKNKPKGFYQQDPIANWMWENFNAIIAYSIRPDEQGVIESIIIESRQHQRYFEKFFKKEEELIQRGMQ